MDWNDPDTLLMLRDKHEQRIRIIPVHPVSKPAALLGLDRGVIQNALLAQDDELRQTEGLDIPLAAETHIALDIDFDPQALAVKPVLIAGLETSHRTKTVE